MIDTRVVSERLQWLAARNGGAVTAEMVVADAKRKTSPLHDHAGFDWDVNSAAETCWIQHARFLIRSVRVIVRTTRHQVKGIGFVRDPRLPRQTPGYVTVASIRGEREVALDAIGQEIAAILGRIERLRSLAVSLDLESEIDDFIERLSTFRARLIPPASGESPHAEI